MKRNVLLLITISSLAVISSSSIYSMAGLFRTEQSGFYRQYEKHLEWAGIHFGYDTENPKTGGCIAAFLQRRPYPKAVANLGSLTTMDLDDATGYAPIFFSRTVQHPNVFNNHIAAFLAWKDAAHYANRRDNKGKEVEESEAYRRAVRGLCKMSQQNEMWSGGIFKMMALCKEREGKDTVDGKSLLSIIKKEFETCDECRAVRQKQGQ